MIARRHRARIDAHLARTLAASALALACLLLPDPATAEPFLACDGSVLDRAALPRAGSQVLTEPPDAPRPVPVELALQIVELNQIDLLKSSFRFEGYADFRMCDPRSAFDPEVEGHETLRYVGTKIEDPTWSITLHISNGVGAIDVTQRLIEVDADGSIRASGYFNSEVATAFDLHRFPFDDQSLEIHLESFSYNGDFVRFVINDRDVSLSDEVYLPEWHVQEISAHIEDGPTRRGQTPHSRAVITIDVSRASSFYVLKLFIPLSLIVALSWSVFWMPEESLAGRIRIASTAFLTIVAYQFAISGSLPKVAYLTLMDRLMVGSFFLVALSALESMVYVSMRAEHPERAARLDRASRWLFPSSFAVAVTSIWLRYGA